MTIENSRYDHRREQADAQSKMGIEEQENNQDLRIIESTPDGLTLPAVFAKTMPQNDLGEVLQSDYNKLTEALELRTQAAFDAVPIAAGSVRKMEDPQGTFDFTVAGGDAFALSIRTPAGMQTAETAGEMVEVYAMALMREESFLDIQNGTTAGTIQADAIADLNAVGDDFIGPKESGMVTNGTLFRGPGAGETVGPYVSQFLQHDFTYGALTVEQLVNVESDSDDSVTVAEFLNIQRGITPGGANKTGNMERMWNVRNLGTYVHNDPVFQAGWHAALILLGNGAPLDSNIPSFNNRTNFQSLGGADLLNRIGHVADLALKAAWRQKYEHLRLRPEVMAARVHFQAEGARSYGLSDKVMNSATVANVLAANTPIEATRLLKLQYPEGSPTHPAFPAGHAVLAGAVCTLLKAWFNGNTRMRDLAGGNFSIIEATSATDTYAGLLAAAAASGASAHISAAAQNSLTVNIELNKLASNIATARNMAGVHYRSDGDQGILLGEKVAIRYLQDVAGTVFSKPFAGFTLQKFDGSTVLIEPSA